MKILTGGQFRELDRITIDTEPIASIDLMERASHAVADVIRQRFGTDRRIIVFAGPGGNGGDGLAVARMLAGDGRDVTAYLFNVSARLSDDCATNRDRLVETDNATLVEVTAEFVFPELRTTDVVIDALFGTGISKSLDGGFALVARGINKSGATVVAIDMPSGLMCEDNTYNDTSSIVRADITVTIQTPKLAFLFPENQKFVGELVTADIGLSQEGMAEMKSHLWITEADDIRAVVRPRPRFAHKGQMGHALLVAGTKGMAGAAILAARAALRSGVGKLTVHTPYENLAIMQTAVPEAVVQIDIDPESVTSSIDATTFQAVGIGPGLGQRRHTAAALHSYLTQRPGPMVVDADALNILAKNTEWMRDIPSDSILTPHPGELDGIVGRCLSTYERMIRARNLAVNLHVFVILKGHYSMVCTPTGEVFFNPTGNPGMATAGSGDVLTGIITALLAQGYLPAEAAMLGTYLHGLAGDMAAEELTEEAMTASDIIAHLPHAFRRLRAAKA